MAHGGIGSTIGAIWTCTLRMTRLVQGEEGTSVHPSSQRSWETLLYPQRRRS